MSRIRNFAGEILASVTPTTGSDLYVVLSVLGHSWMIWILLVVVTWLMVTRIAETYEGAAKLLGPMGRHIVKKYRERDDKYREHVTEQAKILALEIVPQLLPADYETMKIQLRNVIDRVTDLEVENAALRSFVIYDEQWHFTVLLTAAREGVSIDFPSRFTWLEFRERWRHGWRPFDTDNAAAPQPANPLEKLITGVGEAARDAARQEAQERAEKNDEHINE